MKVTRWIAAIAALGVVGCRASDAVAPPVIAVPPPPPRTPTVKITGDTVLALGRTLLLTVAVTDTLGNNTNAGEITLRGSNPDIAFFPAGPLVWAVGSGIDTITASTTYGSAWFVLRVPDDRSTRIIAVGDSLREAVLNLAGVDRFRMDLSAGDTIDFRSTSATLGNPHVMSLSPGLVLTAPIGGIQAGQIVQRTGAYEFAIVTRLACIGHCPASGSVLLETRRSAPVFRVISTARARRLAQGTVVTDTAWLQNLGVGSLTVPVRVTANGAVAPTQSSVTLVGPSPLTSAPTVAGGAVPIITRIDTRALHAGSYSADIALGVPATVWTVDSRTTISVSVLVQDSAGRVMPATPLALKLVLSSSNELYGSDGVRIFRIDRATGEAATVYSLPNRRWRIVDFSASSPGTFVMSLDVDEGSAFGTLSPDGRLSLHVFPEHGIGNVSGLADGTAFFNYVQLMYRVDSVVSVASTPSGVGAATFNAADSSLYSVDGSALVRFDLRRGTVERRTLSSSVSSLIGFDRAGRIYATNGIMILVFDPSGNLMNTLVPPGTIATAAIIDGVIYGSAFDRSGGHADTDVFWKLPIP